ncbi:MAG: acyltransferase [Aquaticitalea sp.]
MIGKIISKIKGDKDYKIESQYSNREWFVLLDERIFQILRGFISKICLVRAKGLFFKGRNVTIKHRGSFSAGKNLILGDNVYLNALSSDGINLGDNITIAQNSILICTGVISNKGTGITIGDNSGINASCYFGGQGGITIGSDVIIGPNVKIFSENHNFENPDIIIKNQGVTRKGVQIGNDCWIGAGATILDGVILQSKTVVAAGSVVTKSFEGNSIIGGIPARVIKPIS